MFTRIRTNSTESLLLLATVLLGCGATFQGPRPTFAPSPTIIGTEQSTLQVMSVQTDASDNPYLFIRFSGQVQLLSDPVTREGQSGYLVVSFTSGGELRWIVRYIAPDERFGMSMAMNAAGDIYVSGTTLGDIMIDDKRLAGRAIPTLFSSRLSTQGELLWANLYETPAHGVVRDTTVQTDGTLYMVGDIDPTDTLTRTSQWAEGRHGTSGFVAAIGTDGTQRWVRPKLEASYVLPSTNGDIAVVSTGDDPYNHDVRLSRITQQGEEKWNRSISIGIVPPPRYRTTVRTYDEDPAWISLTRPAIDSLGNIYFTGRFTGTIQALEDDKTRSVGGTDAFVLSLTRMGDFRWWERFGWLYDDAGEAIAVRGESLFVVGHFTGLINLGMGRLLCDGASPTFAAAFDVFSTPQYSFCIGGAPGAQGFASRLSIAPTSDGFYMAGRVVGTIQIDNEVLTSQRGARVFLKRVTTSREVPTLTH